MAKEMCPICGQHEKDAEVMEIAGIGKTEVVKCPVTPKDKFYLVPRRIR